MRLEMDQLVAVVLAGGLGTRVRHLLGGFPKPMAPGAGKTFLEWGPRYLSRQGLKNIVLSTGHRSDVVEKHFQSHPIKGLHIRCVAEPEPLGTAGGFLHAARASGEKPAAWLVLNGDSLVFANLSDAIGTLTDP